jgi:hypothetical protein
MIKLELYRWSDDDSALEEIMDREYALYFLFMYKLNLTNRFNTARRARGNTLVLREYQGKEGKSATSSAPKKDRLQQARNRGPADPENSNVYFLDERMDTNRKEDRDKQNREEAGCSFRASALKGERKEDRHDSRTILPRRSFHRESGVAPRLRRRADRARRRTTSAGIPSTEEPTPKYPATSRGRRAGSRAACPARRGLRDRRNSGGTRL